MEDDSQGAKCGRRLFSFGTAIHPSLMSEILRNKLLHPFATRRSIFTRLGLSLSLCVSCSLVRARVYLLSADELVLVGLTG